MKTEIKKRYLKCIWWGVVFLLKYDFSMPENKEIAWVNSIELPTPDFVLRLDD